MQRLKENAEMRLPEALEWLRRMVDIGSFTADPAGVDALGTLTIECFEPLGFAAERVQSVYAAYGQHLFLRRAGKAAIDASPVVLVTHLDTVFPSEELVRNGFTWQETDGRIYGPGTVDIKGGTMLIWLMLRMMQDEMPDLFERTHWLIAANAAEEVIGSDFAEATTRLCEGQARAVLVFEGGPRQENDYHIVTSRKGRAEYQITAEGRAAHAGSEHQGGINAVVELGALLPRIAALTHYERGVTVNVASMHGGTVLNRVPHAAVVELEVRAHEPAVMAEIDAALMALAGVTPGGAIIRVECQGRTRAWPGGGATDQLFAHWQAAAAQMGIRAVAVSRGGLSDANYLCTLGPTLDALGPTGGNAHCSEWASDGSKRPEYVEPDSFVPKALLNVSAITRLLQSG